MLDSGYKPTSFVSLRDRMSSQFGLVEAEETNWPPRHIVGLDGDPVPFHRGQELAYDSDYRITAMFAGTQSGKTTFGPWWLVKEIQKRGRGDYLVVTSSYPLFKNKLLPEILRVFEQILGIGRYWLGDRIIELRNPETHLFEARKSTDPMWGRIILGSASAANTLESSTAKAAWLDEPGQDEFTLSAYRAIQRRLSLHRGPQLMTTTLYNLGWTKSQIIDVVKKGGRAKEMQVGEASLTQTTNRKQNINLIQFDSILNPEFSLEEFKEQEEKMPADEFAMFYRGLAAKLRAMIYDCVDDSVLIDDYEIPHNWSVVLGVDPIGQQTAAVWIAYNEQLGRLEIFQEHEGGYGKTLFQHGADILKMTEPWRLNYLGFCGQPAENQARLDIGSSGLQVYPPPIADYWAGINRVYDLFKSGKMVIHRRCERLYSDLTSMKKKKDRATGLLTNIVESKEIWHLPDALRYAIAGVSYTSEKSTSVNYNPLRIGY